MAMNSKELVVWVVIVALIVWYPISMGVVLFDDRSAYPVTDHEYKGKAVIDDEVTAEHTYTDLTDDEQDFMYKMIKNTDATFENAGSVDEVRSDPFPHLDSDVEHVQIGGNTYTVLLSHETSTMSRDEQLAGLLFVLWLFTALVAGVLWAAFFGEEDDRSSYCGPPTL